ncbi:MAG: ABC transporter ATP-binding protein [Ruminococcaceae bacterium]|nr:ABC transporter ATP-binding protein [Oscillospiraceae bacterium]
MNAIETTGLTKYYGKSRGIIDVSIAVEQGQFYGFIGPNGAGKSTTIRTLLGLIQPTSGKATVMGMDIVKDRTAILRRIGYLPGEATFYSGMRVREILALSAKLRGMDCSANAKVLCDRLELDVSRRIDELSLGNRKKVGIVCALQHDPELYILDEPTSGLDPLMQREFYEILRERNQKGATVFLSSHILTEIERYCTDAAVVREGRVLASDSVTKLGHTGVKRVTLRGVTAMPAVDGACDVQTVNGTTSFLYNGDAHRLLRQLSDVPFDDVAIADPDLEEVFMHFYEKEGAQ